MSHQNIYTLSFIAVCKGSKNKIININNSFHVSNSLTRNERLECLDELTSLEVSTIMRNSFDS